MQIFGHRRRTLRIVCLVHECKEIVHWFDGFFVSNHRQITSLLRLDHDDIYEMQVVATDKSGQSATVDLTVTTNCPGTAPQFSHAYLFKMTTMQGRTQAVGQVEATDAEGGPITYHIEGADAEQFTLEGE